MSEPALTVTGRAAGALLLDGKYRLEAPIAVGGMGSVWRAIHTTLDRPVAVKFVDVDRANETVVERFLREAKVAAAIRHPNVIDILDFGRTSEGEPFMVMELLEGRSLDERLADEQPLATIQIIQIAGQILSGLEYVHRAGIVHRDLKPGNVFLSDDGELFARLLDFGISYSVDPQSALRRGRFGTEDRLVVGTPEYMAPEQAEGRPDVDARADIYAVGVIMYEALSGTLPFVAEHSGQVLYKVIKGEHVSLAHLRPDIPEIAAVVESALQREREERPSSARDFRRLLFSAAGIAGDTTGRFHVPRSSGIDLKVSRPPSDPSLAGPSPSTPPAIAVPRDVPTASLGLAPAAVPGPLASVPPPPSSGWAVALVALGVVLALVLGGGIWLATGRGGSEPGAAAAAPAPAEGAAAAPAPAPSAGAAPAALAPAEPAAAAVAPVPDPEGVPAAAVAPEPAAADVAPDLAAAPAPSGPARAGGATGARRTRPAGGAEGDEAPPTDSRRGEVVRELDF